jgi:branched-chain amino acid transport system ATP-binding protein
MLAVKDVYAGYGNIRVLKGISMNISQRQIVALIGANGAGKTTTLKAISGLVPLTTGEIIFDGVDISHKKAHKMIKLGISQVPEGRQVFPELSVLDNLILGGYSIKTSIPYPKESRICSKNFRA